MALEHSENKAKKIKDLLKKEQSGNHLREKLKALEEEIINKDKKIKEIERSNLEKSQLSTKTKDSKKGTNTSNVKEKVYYRK